MKRRVVVTGLGTINPLGNTPAATWEKVVAGQSAVAKLTKCDTTDLKTDFGAEVLEFDPVARFGRKEARRMDPTTQFAVAAAGEALADAGLSGKGNRDDFGVVLGCGMGNMHTIVDGVETAAAKGLRRLSPFFVPMLLADAPAASISIAYGLRGPNLAIATACAAGNSAIGEGAKMIQRGAAEVMLTGGAEAPLLPLVLAGFSVTGALARTDGDPSQANRPFDRNRNGFAVGEGATILILESLAHAEDRGAAIYAEFLGYGTSADAHHISAPPADGGGARLSIERALADAGVTPQDIDYINAHGTGTQLNDKSETRAIKDVFREAAYDTPISSTKPLHGHMLGAAGAVEALVMIKAMEAGIAPPTINFETSDPECDLDYVPNIARRGALHMVMSNGFGLGGHNATIILGKYRDD